MSAMTSSVDRSTRPVVPLLALGGGLILLGLVFLPECQAAVRVWIESTAYGHCFMVAPIAAYLAWDQRARWRGLVPQPTPLFLGLGLPLGLAWFAAERLGIMEGRQLAALGFVELLFLSVLGWPLFRALLGPLLYLVFLVPFGAFVTPVLQGFTARFIDVGLTVLGISHYANDMYVEISAGTFFVAEACAGLRFLIAAVAFGVFYALLNYEGTGRRLVFITASILVPIVANGIRALGIVVLGSVLGSAEAAAADHLVYGWVFFSVVMLLLVLAGLPLRETGPRCDLGPPRLSAGARPAQPWPAALVLILAAIAPGAARALDRQAPSPAPARLSLVAPEGCQVAEEAPGDGEGRSTATIACGRRRWSVITQTLPSRSTAAGVSDARQRVLGATDAENATTRPMRSLPDGVGMWQEVVSEEPPLIAAYSVWIRGAPAQGGLTQRLTQARDSVFGNDRPPLLLVISTRPAQVPSEKDVEAAIAELARIVGAQTGLADQVARATAPGAQP